MEHVLSGPYNLKVGEKVGEGGREGGCSGWGGSAHKAGGQGGQECSEDGPECRAGV